MARELVDESFALDLLKEHLTNASDVGWKCECSENDPPDLIVTWKGGERWGVEVTRAYQGVEAIGKHNAVPSEELYAWLQLLGDEIEGELKSRCQHDYVLFLEMPGPLSSWKGDVKAKKWAAEIRDKIRKHVESDASDILRFPGGTLRPGKSGKRWITSIGAPPTELSSATRVMLRRCFEHKGPDLQRWTHGFSQSWLLVLNCYVLAESKDIEAVLRKVAGEYADKYPFDGIFWSGYPDRSLVRVCLGK